MNSRFEEQPERRMTLRRLLSHRAGFTHGAPVGNNYVPDFESFEAHVKSIQQTWLRYAVGSHHAYSNLGVDLAGYILSVVSGQSYPDYVKRHVLDPLGMAHSSYDWPTIEATRNRAVGRWTLVKQMPLTFALIPSGGLYSSARDMGAFLTFQLNDGRVGGLQLDLGPVERNGRDARLPRSASGQPRRTSRHAGRDGRATELASVHDARPAW